MPGFLARMFTSGGPMAVDHHEVATQSDPIARRLSVAREAVVQTPEGTGIRFSLAGRAGKPDHGLYTDKGTWGNLPAGEACIAPVEGTAQGQIVVPAGWYAGLDENMTPRFTDGLVSALVGGGPVGDTCRDLLQPAEDTEPYRSRRNLAELGVGTNPYA